MALQMQVAAATSEVQYLHDERLQQKDKHKEQVQQLADVIQSQAEHSSMTSELERYVQCRSFLDCSFEL